MTASEQQTPEPGRRLADLSRRAFLTRSAQGAVAAVAVGLLGSCSSHNDSGAFSSAGTTTSAAAAGGASTSTPGDGSSQNGGSLAGSHTTVSFTYSPQDGGFRVNNPYVACWIEDEGGALVKTLGLWFKNDPKGSRYLHELQGWYAIDGSQDTIDTLSSATRTPGDYQLSWDGTTHDGSAAPTGSYVLVIEAAREHGPYSLIRQTITFGTKDAKTTLPDNEELSDAAVVYTAADAVVVADPGVDGNGRDREVAPGTVVGPPDRVRGVRSLSATGQKWMRLIHVYTSMIAMLVVLFFGATGLTLNHPEWTFGFDPTTSEMSGNLPSGSVDASGTPAYLTISDYLRDTRDLRGTVTDFGVSGTQGYISYHGPGYQADVTFDTNAETYSVKVEQQGLVGVLNDLHKGRNANSSWGWVIDASAIFLVVISLTGIGLQLFLRRRRRSAVIIAAIGGVATVIAAILTLR